MNTILLFLVLLLLAAPGLFGADRSRPPAVTAWIKQHLRIMVLGVVLGVVMGRVLDLPLVDALNAVLGRVLDLPPVDVLVVLLVVLLVVVLVVVLGMMLGMMLVEVLVPVLFVMLGVVWSISRKHATKAIEVPDNQRPPQFAEYLLYFLPKAMREPLLGDLEEEYREVYAKFGKREAEFWYYVQVILSFYPLVSSGVRRLVKWGMLGWIGGVVKRLIS